MDIDKGESSYKEDNPDLPNRPLYISENHSVHTKIEHEADSNSYENEIHQKIEYLSCGHRIYGSKLCILCLTNINFEEPKDMSYGECPRCKRQNNGNNWCGSCAKDIYISTLPKEILDYISILPKEVRSSIKYFHELNISSTSVSSFFEFIPWVRLQNIKFLAEGGSGKVYTAEWLNGEIENINFNEDIVKRKASSQFVVLKPVSTNEFLSHYSAAKEVSPKIFGITFDASATFIVMKLFKENVRTSITRDYWNLFWLERMWPPIPEEIPTAYVDLIVRCWNPNPKKRPSSEEVSRILFDLRLLILYYTEILSEYLNSKEAMDNDNLSERIHSPIISNIKQSQDIAECQSKLEAFRNMVKFFKDDLIRLKTPAPKNIEQHPESSTSKIFNFLDDINLYLNPLSTSNNFNIVKNSEEWFRARIQISWDVTDQSPGLLGSLRIQNKNTGESTTINDQLDLTLRRLQWKVSVQPGTYVFAINDGTGEKFSGEFQVAQGTPVGGAKASDATKKDDNKSVNQVNNGKAITNGNLKSVDQKSSIPFTPTLSQGSHKTQAPMSPASTNVVASARKSDAIMMSPKAGLFLSLGII
ncbi:23004_t:CDS:2, partial [Cetraspora pellucida]